MEKAATSFAWVTSATIRDPPLGSTSRELGADCVASGDPATAVSAPVDESTAYSEIVAATWFAT